MPQTLNLVIHSAKADMLSAVNQIMQKYKLPAFLMDGIVCSALADVRQLETTELYREISTQQSETENESHE